MKQDILVKWIYNNLLPSVGIATIASRSSHVSATLLSSACAPSWTWSHCRSRPPIHRALSELVTADRTTRWASPMDIYSPLFDSTASIRVWRGYHRRIVPMDAWWPHCTVRDHNLHPRFPVGGPVWAWTWPKKWFWNIKIIKTYIIIKIMRTSVSNWLLKLLYLK